MKIFKFQSYYYPENVSGSHLSKDLEQAYVDAGFTMELHVPTPTRNVPVELREKYKNLPLEEKYDGRVIVHRFPMMHEGRNPLFRALRYHFVNRRQYRAATRAKNVDVVFGTSTPPTQGIYCAKAARKLSKKYGKKVPYIYNLQDVFPDSLVSTGLAKKNSIAYKIGGWIANRIYKSADIIITIGEDIKQNIMAKGVPEEKIRVIPNWIDTDAVRPIAKSDNALYDELGLERDKFRIVYAGNLGLAQGVNTLIDAARLLEKHEDIEFVIFGKGAQESKLREQAKDLSNVKFFPLMPPERIAEVYSLGDASVVLCKKGTGGAGVPSKTWSIMACATPLLISFDTDSDYCRIINESGAGLCSEAEDASALAGNVMRMYEHSEMRAEMGANARAYAENNVSKDICVAKYIELLKEFDDKVPETV